MPAATPHQPNPLEKAARRAAGWLAFRTPPHGAPLRAATLRTPRPNDALRESDGAQRLPSSARHLRPRALSVTRSQRVSHALPKSSEAYGPTDGDGSAAGAASKVGAVQYGHVSLHAPSAIEADAERAVVEMLERVAPREWPIIVHPGIMRTPELWRQFGPLLCIENMDRRSSIARTCEELERQFERFPDATLP